MIRPTKEDNEMSRKYFHPRAGNFCVRIMKYSRTTLRLNCELLNLDNNQVEARDIGGEYGNGFFKIKFGLLKAGNYKLTLRNISNDIYNVQLCPGKVHNELLVFLLNLNYFSFAGKSVSKNSDHATFLAPNQCYFRPASPFGTIFPYGYTNGTLKSKRTCL
jgi:hypothetical protein